MRLILPSLVCLFTQVASSACFVLINGTLVYPWYPVCYGMDRQTALFSQCCSSAVLNYRREDRHKCAIECLEDGSDACCYDICFAERMKIFTTSGFNVDGVRDALLQGKNQTRLLLRTVKSAMLFCTPALTPPLNEAMTCDMPAYGYEFTKCVTLFIFQRCPDFRASKKCDELRRVVGNCREKTTGGTTTTTAEVHRAMTLVYSSVRKKAKPIPIPTPKKPLDDEDEQREMKVGRRKQTSQRYRTRAAKKKFTTTRRSTTVARRIATVATTSATHRKITAGTKKPPRPANPTPPRIPHPPTTTASPTVRSRPQIPTIPRIPTPPTIPKVRDRNSTRKGGQTLRFPGTPRAPLTVTPPRIPTVPRGPLTPPRIPVVGTTTKSGLRRSHGRSLNGRPLQSLQSK